MTALLIAVLFGLLFLHPYIFYPLSLRLFRRRPVRVAEDGPLPSATLVFCAYNEAAALPDKIANLRAIRQAVPHIQFKAYVDLSTDGTLDMLRANADLLEVFAAEQRTGKASGMRILAHASTSEIMIFTDANVLVDPATVPRMLRYFSDPEVGGVCGTLVYVNPGESATSSVNSFYWRLEERIKKDEARSGSTMGADGSLFATRRALYPEVPAHLLDDFIVSMSVVFAGKRLISAPDVIAYEKSAARSADEYRRKRRIACRAYSSHRHLAPAIRRMSLANRYKYLSHRFIRWYGATWAVLSASFALAGVATLWGLMPTVVLLFAMLVALWAVLHARRGPLGRVAELLRALWATMRGVGDALAGKRYQTWQPAQSR